MANVKDTTLGYPDYEKEVERVRDFITTYRTPVVRRSGGAAGGGGGDAKYEQLVESIGARTEQRFLVELDDVQLYAPELVTAICQNTRRYTEVFSSALDQLLPEQDRIIRDERIATVNDVVRATRIKNLDNNPDVATEGKPLTPAELSNYFPPKLLRNFEVRFSPLSSSKAISLRHVGAPQIGKLVTIRAMVIRASDVKPLMEVASYCCDLCGWEAYQEVTGKTFMPLTQCISKECTTNKVDGKIRMLTRGSKFCKYQELRVQELPDQVPVGHIPRSMTVVCRGETTRSASAGDVIVLTGIFLPTPFTGVQAIRAGLTADTYIEAHIIRRMKKASAELLDADIEDRVNEIADSDPYHLLSRSIAPEIFGMEDVKKALLLQLVGGVTQQQADGMKTRGDINICLMGDPGVAKSQLLKYISKLAPRCVYTTGKGSSGVGLTAAVIRDPTTDELTLEGGALVLADMGICCIDEFDKMDESDRTAIHEVMEQQTVSIAKAGITTSLNARTAILAAANPRYGRYNRRADADAHVALQKNINLPAALLSRFDLLFLLLDEVDGDVDKALAAHVTYVHQKDTHPPLDFDPVPANLFRQYLSIAKHIVPYVPQELTAYIVEAYVDMRTRDKSRASATGGRSTLTARQLLSILRMAQGLARLKMEGEVTQADVDEAIRLVYVSKSSVMDSEAGDKPLDSDHVSRIWALIRDKGVTDRSSYVTMADAERIVTAAGFNKRHFEDFLSEYEALQIVSVNASRTRIDFVWTA